jgi:hypothetical protein
MSQRDPEIQKMIDDSMASVVWKYQGEDVTRGELWTLHQSVESSEGWKMPINAIIDDLSDRDLALLDYAIIFFSGCSAEFYSVEGQPNKTQVIADGYYRSVGA